MALRLVTARYNWVSKAYYGASNQAKHAISIEIPEIYLSKSILETNVNSIDSNINRLLNILEKKSSAPFLESFLKYKMDGFRSNLLDSIRCDNEELNKATAHLISATSKLFRPIFALKIGNVIKHLSTPNLLYSDNIEKLIQAYELVHVGSLIHDDILDNSDKRRKIASTHQKYGIKLALLAGDILLSKAAYIIANLESPILCKKVAKVINDLIHGELMDIRADDLSTYFDNYLKKNFLKTASLIAECCSSVSIIANSPQWVVDLSYKIGLHVGMAFQIYDDYLDYKSTTDDLGKPALNDLSQGIVTFPLLSLGSEKFSEVVNLMQSNEYSKILDIVNEEKSLERTRLAVLMHLEKCFEIFDMLSLNENAKTISEIFALIYKTLTRLSN
ncbi:hexaprenyl-diphosphate synthase [Babesia microti strain RI]|uniref:Hexaprenyl-diphosphate synthase n=1 Tax=Babesia microti (strain RI) TaxID=1133968 RepID=A0A1N6LWK1_BABMR|nr:hexaprenyl-diphosphate synthase [Babesia microti strain RI]SIO73248.1 hexaprenyl-diphosphate synthase [Babesia microti strain RI]|eukprot:XP_021337355.1 hexaprenyl-diphosphate synthase [Babesia microti strain RI]